MTAMDHRMVARRHAVREGVARARLRWLLGLIVSVLAAGFLLVAVRSDALAVRSIEINGAVNSDAAGVIAARGLRAGIPTISVRSSAIEEALLTDPWVAKADVRVVWPGTIEVTVLEHVPAGWIRGARGWVRVSTTGTVLERSKPPKRAAVVKGPELALRPGDVIEDESVVAALEFVALLPPRLAHRAEVRTGGKTLRANVAGRKVHLGSSDDIAHKAAALIAIMKDGVAERARISVVAPSRPAVQEPSRSS